MSASLENQFISDRYTSLLHLSGSNLTDTLDNVYDGLGNKSPLEISTEKVVVKGIDISLDTFFPINSILFTADNVNPGTRISNTTWVLISEGKFIAGVGTGSDINGATHTVTEGDTDAEGEYDHTLTIEEMPAHSHETIVDNKDQTDVVANNSHRVGREGNARGAISITSSVVGGGQPFHNTPPAFGLYVWRRSA
jgi:hypothetical protein